jgi:hypothetical protein
VETGVTKINDNQQHTNETIKRGARNMPEKVTDTTGSVFCGRRKLRHGIETRIESGGGDTFLFRTFDGVYSIEVLAL